MAIISARGEPQRTEDAQRFNSNPDTTVPGTKPVFRCRTTEDNETGKEGNAKLFENLTIKDARSMVLVKRAFKLVLGAYLVIGLVAGYRAWFQVKSLELQSTDSILRRGSAIETTVVSYARTPVDVRLELVQGAHSETFAVQLVPNNTWSFFDPRTRQASQTAVLTGDVLGRFEAGKALVRATAIGRRQLTRLPPPLVRELLVEIQREQ